MPLIGTNMPNYTNKHAKLYLPSTFQASNTELPSPKIET